MTVLFISRHPAALEWAEQEGIHFDRLLPHLELQEIAKGDVVIGSLPVNLAYEVCRRGARYRHLALDLTPGLRGIELSAEQMRQCQARLEEFMVTKTEPHEQSV